MCFIYIYMTTKVVVFHINCLKHTRTRVFADPLFSCIKTKYREIVFIPVTRKFEIDFILYNFSGLAIHAFKLLSTKLDKEFFGECKVPTILWKYISGKIITLLSVCMTLLMGILSICTYAILVNAVACLHYHQPSSYSSENIQSMRNF